MSNKDANAPGLVPQITVEAKSPVSKLQRQFNNKIKKINKLKEKIAKKQAIMAQAQARVQAEIQPLFGKLVEKRIELVKLLDRLYDLPFFKKREKEKIAYLIEDISYDLIEKYKVEELIEVYDKYAVTSYADAMKQADEEAREMAEDLLRNAFGLDIDMDDVESLEDLEKKVEEQFDQQEKEREEKKSARKKTKAQLAKEEKMKAEMNNISKASRRVYTELAKVLHPDKEKDEATKAWKEEAMKKVTQAYKQDDFFELLRLQMEYIESQGENLNQLSEEQLRYYLKILNEQAKELEEEDYSFSFGFDAHFYHQYCGTPKQMDQKIGSARNSLERELQQLNQDLQEFEEPANLRAFLKELRFR